MIRVNQQTKEFQGNISSLLKDMGYENPKGMAVAVNNKVVPKTDWSTFELKENDQVTIVKAAQGG